MAPNKFGIRLAERDRELGIDADDWPMSIEGPDGWERQDDRFHRTIVVEGRTATVLRETMLRFPSAPIHGLQRLHQHHVRLGPAERFHTLRILQHAEREADVDGPKTRRIVLFHNGLNERDTFELQYRLAAELIDRDSTTACVVRPFPGHLTRFPFQAFAETPLDRYLSDGSQLFRQFMRYMVEEQWFLSAMVRRSNYRCASGANLLAASEVPSESRLNGNVLAQTILAAWTSLQSASALALKEAYSREPNAPPLDVTPPSVGAVATCIDAVRKTLALHAPDYPDIGGGLGSPDERPDPDFHVLGYSLGGSTAQSVLMSWPFLISSCCSLHGGGPLKWLAPTGFASPEEWQTVLHSLRYELDDRLMNRRVANGGGPVAGMDFDLFAHFKRIFYEVFQQEYGGSFQTRVAAFRQRMLFIVGGDDDVVAPRHLRESAPPGGMNLLEIGGVGHFLAGTPRSNEEDQQRSFWLPEVAELTHRFADEAARYHLAERTGSWFDERMEYPVHVDQRSGRLHHGEWFAPAAVQSLSPTEKLEIDQSGALRAQLFERCLDDLLFRVTARPGDGLLLILRNELPFFLLPPAGVRERAAAMYHDDASIANYCRGIRARKAVMERLGARICFVLPHNVRSVTLNMDAQGGYPSQSESAGGHVAQLVPMKRTMQRCAEELARHVDAHGVGCVRFFDGRKQVPEFKKAIPGALFSELAHLAHDEELKYIATLPDCWLWVSRRFLDFGSETFSIDEGLRALRKAVAGVSVNQLEEYLGNEDVRVIQVSRARYNPRYRGRLVVGASTAKKTLVHVAACTAMSTPARRQDVLRQLSGPARSHSAQRGSGSRAEPQ